MSVCYSCVAVSLYAERRMMSDLSIIEGLRARRDYSIKGIERERTMCDAITWRMKEHPDAKDIDDLRSSLERRRKLIRTLEADVADTDRLIREHEAS